MRADRKLVLLLVSAMLAATGCTRGAVGELPAPPTTGSTTSTTARPDLTGVSLAGVPGTTTTSIPLGPGDASVTGVVTAPEGVVEGATVLIERLVGDGLAGAALTTGGDGRFSAEGILGGRYRIRAWRAPDLAITTPESFFLGSDEKRELELKLESFTGVVVTSAMAPSPPTVDEPVRLVVGAYTRSVDSGGIVRNQPLPSVQLELAGSSQWRVETANPTVADGSGRADWILRCGSPGTHSLAVRVGGGSEALALRLPACALTGEESSEVTDPDGEGSTTSTTRRRTTSTTEADE